MLRTIGARLAVPLLLISLLPSIGHALAAPIDGCRPTPDGIVCVYGGTTTSTVVVPGSTPPLRYLATLNGFCWYWSRYPPGLDSWDSANDQAIILTRFRLPECAGRTTPPPTVITSVRAWEIFRAFRLDAPAFSLTPHTGITNLPTRLHLVEPRVFRHDERLPDGRTLQVEAVVVTVWLAWGDGTPLQRGHPAAAVGDPGSARHTYALKTCPTEYRRTHLDGPKCHPTLDRYPVRVTFEWQGRYRAGGEWKHLGSIDRSSTTGYDVDEVLGVLTLP